MPRDRPDGRATRALLLAPRGHRRSRADVLRRRRWLSRLDLADHAQAIVFRHLLTNITIEIDGTRAGTESYWTLVMWLANGDGAVDLTSGGRYIDDFEEFDDVWAIRHRRVVRDWNRADPVSDLSAADFLATLAVPQSRAIPAFKAA